jgi:hypothetical protein
MTRFIRPCALPPNALLQASRDAGAYTDCYACEVPGQVSHAAFVEAFYTTPLFKLERTLLGWLAHRPATDVDARRLAEGTADRFSAWRVQARGPNQLLLADFTGRTQSWLMVAHATDNGRRSGTRLYFGSAVVPQRPRQGEADRGITRMGFAFHALLGFHRLYSRLLLGAARSRVQRLP